MLDFKVTGRSSIDTDNVRLETVRCEDLLFNGDFSRELDHGFRFTASNPQWHARGLPVPAFFDQGLLGLTAFRRFSMAPIEVAVGRASRGELRAGVALASVSGFLVVGLFDTPMDATRFLVLILLVGGLCGFRNLTDLMGQQNG